MRWQDGSMAERFVSEPLEPDPAAIEAAGMAAGIPGLPRRFTWNGRTHEIARVLKQWREAGPERGRSGPDAERYARRHGWHVVTTTGIEMKFYCERQARSSRRWWVYSVKE
jgi:hypothetical protein